jgi:hypothetical protein
MFTALIYRYTFLITFYIMVVFKFSELYEYPCLSNRHTNLNYSLALYDILTTINYNVMTFQFTVLMQAVATSFSFTNPPKISLNIDSSASKHRKKIRKVEGRRH